VSVKGPANPERSFGISVGAVLCVIAAVLAWRGRTTRAEVLGGIGAVLVVFGYAYPPLLKWPSMLWWRFARVLAYVNARILLTLMFAIALVPLHVIWKISGTDPLARKRGKWPGWTPYPARYRDRHHYVRMF
jgi:hypothetical protein